MIVFLIFLTDFVKSLITSVSHVSFQVLIPHNFNKNKLYFKILSTKFRDFIYIHTVGWSVKLSLKCFVKTKWKNK